MPRWDEDGNESTWKPPTPEQLEYLKRQPQPGLQEHPMPFNEIGRKPPATEITRHTPPQPARKPPQRDRILH